MPPVAYATEEATTASVPATAHQPPSRCTPVTSATPPIPIASPAIRDVPSGSCGGKRRTKRATKIGTEAVAIAATLASMFLYPHATQLLGKAAVTEHRE